MLCENELQKSEKAILENKNYSKEKQLRNSQVLLAIKETKSGFAVETNGLDKNTIKTSFDGKYLYIYQKQAGLKRFFSLRATIIKQVYLPECKSILAVESKKKGSVTISLAKG